jgi:hypothetical protein
LRPDFSTLSFNADIAVEESPRRIYPVLVDPELALISVFLGLLFLEPDVQRAVLWNVSGELPTRQVQHSKQWPLFEVAGSVVADEFNIRVVQGETTVDGCHLHVDHQWREVLHGHKWSEYPANMSHGPTAHSDADVPQTLILPLHQINSGILSIITLNIASTPLVSLL